jgi:hypothetical protein
LLLSSRLYPVSNVIEAWRDLFKKVSWCLAKSVGQGMELDRRDLQEIRDSSVRVKLTCCMKGEVSK